MTRAAAAPFSGRAKWGEVLGNVLLAALGGVLLLVAVPALSGREPVGLWLLVLYTAYAVVVTLALALVVAVTRQLPSLSEESLDGRPATVLRTWAAPWWHSLALDAGLAVVGVALAVAGLLAGGDWAVAGILPGVVGLWFLGRVVLVVVGRRRRPALWLTDTAVVVDSHAGRARVARADVREVRSSGRRLVLVLEGEADRVLAPRPWRTARAARDTLVLDCTDTAHRAAALATWLTGEVARSRPGGFDAAPTGRPGWSAMPRRRRRSGPSRDQ